MKTKPFCAPALAAALSLTAIPAFAQETVSAAPVADPDAALQTMVGKKAPAFVLPDQNDKTVRLKDSKGKWVVLAFYPADMTPGCTFQNRSYSQNFEKFAPLNAVVYTVSTQNTGSKREFCSKESLKNVLLSDIEGKTAKAYGVLKGTVARRVTFYIDPAGNIAAIDTRPKVQQAAEDSIAMLEKLSAGKTRTNERKGR
ncbi:MAG: peroxiredoxin [Capsulimonadales bacterium]|nr:peroxiredoxin [Capsulimonadales bacterium]